MAAAERYYESVGQNWERAAFIKARPVGGELDYLDDGTLSAALKERRPI